jgi:hypothetical protein
MLILANQNAGDMRADIEQAIDALRPLVGGGEEPMFNLLVRYIAGRYVAMFFPRRAHRPACYFATGREQLAVSPAVLEMAGLLVTTEPDHFGRIDAATAQSIYDQVSLEPAHFAQLVAHLT